MEPYGIYDTYGIETIYLEIDGKATTPVTTTTTETNIHKETWESNYANAYAKIDDNTYVRDNGEERIVKHFVNPHMVDNSHVVKRYSTYNTLAFDQKSLVSFVSAKFTNSNGNVYNFVLHTLGPTSGNTSFQTLLNSNYWIKNTGTNIQLTHGNSSDSSYTFSFSWGNHNPPKTFAYYDPKIWSFDDEGNIVITVNNIVNIGGYSGTGTFEMKFSRNRDRLYQPDYDIYYVENKTSHITNSN